MVTLAGHGHSRACPRSLRTVAIDGAEVSLWVRNVILAVLADVRFFPVNDRNSDLPAGREVPEADKMQYNKRAAYSTTSSARASSMGGISIPISTAYFGMDVPCPLL